MSNLLKCDELSERSKNDMDIIVGSEIRAAIQEASARIADLNGLIDMMRENAVAREKRIAELEARNEVQRVHLEEQIERLAELEAENTETSRAFELRKYLDTEQIWELRKRADQAEADLAEMRDRKCEGCASFVRWRWSKDGDAVRYGTCNQGTYGDRDGDIASNFCCNCYWPREGGE